MTTECSRAWQAEAALDGRLSRVDAESFRRHAATCECCAREIRSLDTLGSIAQRLPNLTSTPLEQRRLRQSVLRAANELALQPRRAPMKPALGLGAFAAAVVVLFVFWLLFPRENGSAVAAGAPTYQIQTSEGAAWTSRNQQTTVRLLLESGWFEISVDKLRAEQRFILELPDGELEVKGTRFLVEVRDAKTVRVRVDEGRVALRLRGEPSVLLLAGDTWPTITAARTGKGSTPPVKGSNEVGAAPDASASSTESKTALARVPEASTLPSRRGGSVAQPSATDPVTPAGDSFAQAISAFTAGDFGKAEQLLTAFERAHPGDARVEDATFLRAVARARRGDVAAARSIARDYLRRYPNGLRRAEAERLLR